MGRRKGNCLVQRAQRAQQRAQIAAEIAAEAKAAAKAAEEAAAQAKAQAEAEAEARKARLIREYDLGIGIAFRSQQKWGGKISGDKNLLPFVWVEYHSYPNGSAYYKAQSLVGGVSVENVYEGGTDLGVYFFSRNLKEVKVS